MRCRALANSLVYSYRRENPDRRELPPYTFHAPPIEQPGFCAQPQLRIGRQSGPNSRRLILRRLAPAPSHLTADYGLQCKTFRKVIAKPLCGLTLGPRFESPRSAIPLSNNALCRFARLTRALKPVITKQSCRSLALLW